MEMCVNKTPPFQSLSSPISQKVVLKTPQAQEGQRMESQYKIKSYIHDTERTVGSKGVKRAILGTQPLVHATQIEQGQGAACYAWLPQE
jgi:hypothetical protein